MNNCKINPFNIFESLPKQLTLMQLGKKILLKILVSYNNSEKILQLIYLALLSIFKIVELSTLCLQNLFVCNYFLSLLL